MTGMHRVVGARKRPPSGVIAVLLFGEVADAGQVQSASVC